MKRLALYVTTLACLVACAGTGVQAASVPRDERPALPEPAVDQSFRARRPKAGPPVEAPFPVVESGSLPNGLTFHLIRRPVGIVSLSVIARGGALGVPPGKSGLAAFTARLMTEGTTSRSSLELAEHVEGLGASLIHDAGREYTALGMTVLEEDVDPGLELLADVVKNPGFSPKEIERVRGEWLDSLEEERQEPQRLASLAGLRVLYGEHAGAPVSGSRTDIERLRRPDLVRYHREHFTPKNVAIVAAGATDLDTLRRVAERHFGSWKSESRPVHTPSSSTRAFDSKAVILVDRPGSVQSALFVGQPMPRRSEPGFEARDLLNNAVGGLFTSRLNANLREKHGYTYGARSIHFAGRDLGGFLVMTAVRSDVTAEALEQIFVELRAVAGGTRPLGGEEIARSRADLVEHVGAALEQTSALMGKLQDLVLHGLSSDYFTNYGKTLEALRAEAVATEAKRLTVDRMAVVVVGDRATIQPALESKGFRVEAAPAGLVD